MIPYKISAWKYKTLTCPICDKQHKDKTPSRGMRTITLKQRGELRKKGLCKNCFLSLSSKARNNVLYDNSRFYIELLRLLKQKGVE